jgi:tryptophan-rich sensory protein
MGADWTSGLAALPVFIGLCFLVALSGAFYRPGAWYERLRKPPWRPPNWVFAPAWSVLYVLIAISGWLVWRDAGWPAAAPALAIYGVQLLLNAGWSAVFFGLRRPDWAFLEISLLWLSIAWTIQAFAPLQPVAAWLLAPYLAWVSFAALLNFSIWQRNREGTWPGGGSWRRTPHRNP